MESEEFQTPTGAEVIGYSVKNKGGNTSSNDGVM
jgi:hypothetical protein